MGMFDSLYDHDGNEWQTKAYGCNLDDFQIGDALPNFSGGGWYDSPVDSLPEAYQVRVLGGPYDAADDRYAWATVRDYVLVEVPAERDPSLPAVDYHGGPAMDPR